MSALLNKNWKDLIKPAKLEVKNLTNDGKRATVTAEPLERGFGITLGNALRRVLLSSLQGTSVCAVRIDGALHEFTSIPDITEDVADIILNLKDVLLDTLAAEPRVLQIDVSADEDDRVVTAGDLITDGSVKILNADQKICTIAKCNIMIIF